MQLNEGRNRVVRRMFQALGLPLRQLHREAIGPLSCAKLGLVSGQIAAVPSDQLLCLLAACQKDQKGQDAAGGWSPDHGRAVYNALRCGSLLCNVRRGGKFLFVSPQFCVIATPPSGSPCLKLCLEKTRDTILAWVMLLHV